MSAVKSKNNTRTSTSKLLKKAAYASTGTASCLICIKLTAWLLTGSIAIMASLVDSLMDAASSLINLFAIRYSLKSPDEDHQFGHGKAESLAGLAQASFIAGSGLFLLIHTGERLANPQPLKELGIGIWIMVIAVIVTTSLVLFQNYVIRKTGSIAIKADSLHYKTDILSNTAGIAVLILSCYGWNIFDPVLAFAIAIYVLYSSGQIAADALDVLMDRELPGQTRQKICDIALTHGEVTGIHDLRTRLSGQTVMIQFHLNIDGSVSLSEAHRIAKEVEAMLFEEFPDADIIIHQDPEQGENASSLA